MDQVEVDVVEAEVGKGTREGRLDGLAGTARGFGGDEELGAGDGGAGDGGAEFALVAVGWFWWRRLGTGEEEVREGWRELTLGTVEVVVAAFDGGDGVVDDLLVELLIVAAFRVPCSEAVAELVKE